MHVLSSALLHQCIQNLISLSTQKMLCLMITSPPKLDVRVLFVLPQALISMQGVECSSSLCPLAGVLGCCEKFLRPSLCSIKEVSVRRATLLD